MFLTGKELVFNVKILPCLIDSTNNWTNMPFLHYYYSKFIKIYIMKFPSKFSN